MTKDNLSNEYISVHGAKEHNLKNVNIDIPRNQFVVVTGLSGSGKSSLAFDTVYAEGQRRYVESLSAYARQFLQLQNKPDVEYITGLSPAIAIDQKTVNRNPRSTVGTVTEIYDYMRLLFARIGVAYSPATGLPIKKQTVSQMVDQVMQYPEGAKIYLLAPIARQQKGEHRKELAQAIKAGFERIYIDGTIYDSDDLPEIEKTKKHDIEIVVDRLVVKEDIKQRLADSIETALKPSNGLLIVEVAADSGDYKKGARQLFSEHLSCPESGFSLPEIEPRLFSFNSPFGACPKCDGLGTEVFFDPELVLPDHSKTLSEGAIVPWANSSGKFYMQTLECLAKHYDFDLYTPFNELSQEHQNIVLYGSGDEEITIVYNDNIRTKKVVQPFEGVIPSLERRWKESESQWVREDLSRYHNLTKCSSCDGHRLKKETLCVKINGLHIGEVCQMPIEESIAWFKELHTHLTPQENQIAARVLKELIDRISFLNDVGLGYLTLARESGTLSGGESQRIRLASQIGSGLSGVLYVLDEPSIGLHQCDNERLLRTLQTLRDLGNTVLVVEHDEETMHAADYLIDVGPGAGVHGGNIIAKGTPAEVAKQDDSITAQYLSGKLKIDVPSERRRLSKNRKLQIFGARANNLKNVDAEIPLGTFTAVTGVSGGGKSSLIIHTLYKGLARLMNNSRKAVGAHDRIEGTEYIDKIIEIDQSPIGRTPRSNPATYTGAFSHIRDLFAGLPEAKARGYKSGRFSFNVKGGRCEACQGDGVIKIEMHFLPDVYVQCDACHGERYNRETLEIKYKGKTISDVLRMTVEEAAKFFKAIPMIREKLDALNEVGLSYIQIGQSATTLSGGEAQRVKLAKELSRKSTGRTLYILDEPTTGLHSHDISKLLKVLHKLVDHGNTVLVIEHNIDVIKTADYIIDVGPQGGAKGGIIVAQGRPEEVAAVRQSVTGKYIAKALEAQGIKVEAA